MRPAPRPRPRSGFTIVELLIAATISLILTYAVIQMFDYVASEARYGRASIELAGQLRSASRRIQTDLNCATSPTLPYAGRPGQGYVTYIEGPGSDSIAMVYTAGGIYPTTNPGSYAPTARTSNIDLTPPLVGVETSLGGDIDDILMFTAYNPDEPFRGRYTPYEFDGSIWTRGATQLIESKYAEIVLWTVRSPEGRVNLYRRALLIRPDLNPWRDRSPSAPVINYPPPGYYTWPTPAAGDNAEVKRRMQICYQENDLSVRYVYYPGNPSAIPAIPPTAALIGNTLSDLERRENRFAHLRSNATYQYPVDAQELQVQDPALDRSTVAPGWLLTNDVVVPDGTGTNGLYAEGNDVLLGEVLAFDVKAYDPLATVRLDPDSFSLNPSDPGFAASSSSPLPNVPSTTTPIGPAGAFVDLGYDVTQGYDFTHGSGTWFSGNPHPKSRLYNVPYYGSARTTDPDRFAYRTYCTWTSFYEMNSFNENATVPLHPLYADTVTDGGANGVDDDGDGAVDEVERSDWWPSASIPAPPARNRYIGEGDTSPPYPRALRGLQITLRVMEPNSRQVRQMTVVQNFVGE